VTTERLNAFRREAGVPEVVALDYLDRAAIDHSGYQAIAFSLSHLELDPSNPLYRGRDPSQRVNLAATGDPAVWPPGVTAQYEDVASAYVRASIPLLWNTVYHRLPLMRSQVYAFGSGDAAAARRRHGRAVLGSLHEDFGFTTLELVADGTLPRGASHWPADGQRLVELRFDTDSEFPDPLDGPGRGPNDAPAVGTCGPPLHIVVPILGDFTQVQASLVDEAGRRPELIILVGGAAPSGSYRDSLLEPGECFLLPVKPLRRGRHYQVSVVLADGASTWSQQWSFTTRE
jgi:hypothetical protein